SRRHTRFSRDWSSDVCSSDLNFVDLTVTSPPYDNLRKYKGFEFNYKAMLEELYRVTKAGGVVVWIVNDATIDGSETGTSFKQARSEERRVGNECRERRETDRR